LSGNLWSRTIRGARAERIEYLLLHEFHTQKYILPEKKAYDNGTASGKKNLKAVNHAAMMDDDDEHVELKVGGKSRTRAKASYAGGLVLEPKKGLYDTYILLLDFNSLYPSIIQEYNLCFTTIQWTKYVGDQNNNSSSNKNATTTATNTKDASKKNSSKKKSKKSKKVTISNEASKLANKQAQNEEVEDEGEHDNDDDDDASSDDGQNIDDDENNNDVDANNAVADNTLAPIPDRGLAQGYL
jgi:DNA polymerase elongation subunit (family B)